jgi:methyl-accepting chemotaxis protein-1 (serine sensor receptor)
MFRNTSVGMRLVYLIAFNSLLLIGIGIAALVAIRQSNEAMRHIYGSQLAASKLLADARSNQMLVRVLLDQAAFAPDSPEMAKRIAGAEGFMQKSIEAWAAYNALDHSAEEQRLAEEVGAKRDAFFNNGVKPLVEALRNGDRDAIGRYVMETIPALDRELNARGGELAAMQLASAKSEYDTSQDNYRMFMQGAAVLITLGVLLGIGVAWLIRASIVRPLAEMLSQFEKIAVGDLSADIPSAGRNEIGRLMDGLRRMQQSLSAMVRDLRSGSSQIATASQEIATGNTDLSQRTEEQAASLQQTAANMERLAETVKQNASSARQASALSVDASAIAAEGGRVVNQVIETMGNINTASTKIVDIIAVIEGIAFQTNILALNAAVEAARAGEQGRGFAVVASEVRTLAQRSSGAAKEIKDLINNSVAQVANGTALVDQAGQTMEKMVDAVQRVERIMAEISRASAEQSSGIGQMATAISQMDSVTQQNAALVEEAAAVAESLEEQAARLNEAVAAFRLSQLDDRKLLVVH